MSVSTARGGIFFLIGLPVGFILAGLGIAISGGELVAPNIAPFAFAVAAAIGVTAALWKTKS
ncbi:hypothetical protein BPTFM16_00645 [Altererythrobacter insulae]|nr:hypothetical protein BPTFM16_00645 [Altererythrobacter insulae]